MPLSRTLRSRPSCLSPPSATCLSLPATTPRWLSPILALCSPPPNGPPPRPPASPPASTFTSPRRSTSNCSSSARATSHRGRFPDHASTAAACLRGVGGGSDPPAPAALRAQTTAAPDRWKMVQTPLIMARGVYCPVGEPVNGRSPLLRLLGANPGPRLPQIRPGTWPPVPRCPLLQRGRLDRSVSQRRIRRQVSRTQPQCRFHPEV